VYPAAEVVERIAAHVADCRRHRREADVVYPRAIYMDDDPAQARREVETALRNFLAYNASPVSTLPGREELERGGYGFYATGTLERLARLSYEEIVEREIAFVGTPEDVAEKIARIEEIPGVGEFAVIANFGGIEHWKALKTLDLFGRRVMPALGRPAVRRGEPDAPNG
jgi:alkanesulfonate monooxygenase SsuD/methylene tetrahydromethanopterin reductase-like flavin-dependent oxidoreductase (luciferase family)